MRDYEFMEEGRARGRVEEGRRERDEERLCRTGEKRGRERSEGDKGDVDIRVVRGRWG